MTSHQSGVRLVVQSDDFGMCHAVNDGVAQAFTEGILTQASMMPPCPWFDEAATIAHELDLPVGMHSTLTCDWDRLRWGPLTDGRTLTDDGIAFRSTVAAAAAAIDHDDAVEELEAQAARMCDAGLRPTYFDCHMGIVAPRAYQEICERYDRPFLYPPVERAVPFTSIKMLSERPTETKKSWLLRYLSTREPGLHLLFAHCAVDSAELGAIASRSHPSYEWVREYRLADQAVLCDPEVREAVEANGIELVSLAEALAS
jgi:predicted glycoside hydrolase/deacetylase ChbG (UPF0249 family)